MDVVTWVWWYMKLVCRTKTLKRPRGGKRGYSREFLLWLCRPVLQILTLFHAKKCYFPHPFSDMKEVTKRNIHVHKLDRNYIIITEIRTPTKRFLKIHLELHIMGLFLFSLGPIDKYVHTPPQLPRKLHPIPDQDGRSLYPYFRLKRCKNHTLWGGPYLYGSTPPPPTGKRLCHDCLVQLFCQQY